MLHPLRAWKEELEQWAATHAREFDGLRIIMEDYRASLLRYADHPQRRTNLESRNRS